LAFAHGAIWEILIATALLGIGIGLAFSAMSAIVVDAVPSHQTGVASGMNANIRTIGGSIGAAVMTSVVTADKLPTGLPKESGGGHHRRRAGRPADPQAEHGPRRAPARAGRPRPRRVGYCGRRDDRGRRIRMSHP
jgi:hypothetical protein